MKTRNDQIKSLQKAFNDLTESSTTAANLANSTIAGLQSELEGEKAAKSKELSDAYSMGFFDYLVNFLAGDPNYDWTKLFAPSTPAFMEKFKESKAAAIEKARQALQAKIQTEQEALSKKASEAQTAKGGGDGDGEATATDQQKN